MRDLDRGENRNGLGKKITGKEWRDLDFKQKDLEEERRTKEIDAYMAQKPLAKVPVTKDEAINIVRSALRTLVDSPKLREEQRQTERDALVKNSQKIK